MMESVVILVVVAILLGGLGEEARRARIRRAYRFGVPNELGGARFASDADLKRAGAFRRRGLRVGLGPDGRRALFHGTQRHLLTVAGARSGKGTGLLIPAILSSTSRKHSFVVVDPKAELAAVTGAARKRCGRVYVLNPFGILTDAMRGLTQACFNPLDILDPESRGFHADCDKLADAICYEEGQGSQDSHWIVSARLLISGVIAALVRHGKPEEKNLAAVRHVIASGQVWEFCREAMKSPDPFIRQKLGRFAQESASESRELNGIVSTADTQTGFIGSAAIAGSLSRSDFRFADLKKRPATVYVCLPLNKLDVTSKYFRLLVAAALSDLLDAGRLGRGTPVVMLLDEMASIGPLKALSDALGMAAGAAGVVLWGVVQGLGQLKSMYPKSWEGWVQNSISMWFAVRDEETAEYVSKLCGPTGVLAHSRSVVIDQRTKEPVATDSASHTSRPLLHPYEVRALGADEMILFLDGVPPVRAKRRPYFRCLEFLGTYRPNPYLRKRQ